VPYKDQDNIGVYDSTSMRQDYYSLFSDRRYAGLDRISDSSLHRSSPAGYMMTLVMNEFGWPLPKPILLRPGSSSIPAMPDHQYPLSALLRGDAKINEQWLPMPAQYDVDQSQLSSANSAVSIAARS
jgi:LPS-assembly protein